MEGRTEFVTDLSLFLEKSEYGISHVYQLHRELGGVFIDASFQDEQNAIFKTRIEIVSPKFIVGELKWDEGGFPYELETYEVGKQLIEVPLYRPFGPAFKKFLFDIVEQILADDRSTIPTDIIENCLILCDMMRRIREHVRDCKNGLGDKEQHAIDAFCGDISISDRDDYNMEEALVEYLSAQVIAQRNKYSEAMKTAEEKRHETLLKAVSELVNDIENTLKKHNFKKGFVSN